MKKILKKIWRIIRIPIYIILALLVVLVIYRLPVAIERSNTAEIVADINNQKLTMKDVVGENLPPAPDEKLNNSTLTGIDANNNGIRDDVELAIFKLYPNSAKIRSGALQYAKAMQMHFRKDITNSEIFVEVLLEKNRGHFCLAQTIPKIIFPENATNEEKDNMAREPLALMRSRLEGIENLVFNTNIRKNKKEENYEKYMTSYGDIDGSDCDIDPLTLLN